MKEIFLLLGSNQGDRLSMMHKARESIASEAGKVIAASSLYETEPWGFTDPVKFLNQVLEIDSELDPGSLLSVILNLEKKLGRVRKQDTACRTSCLTELPNAVFQEITEFSGEPPKQPSGNQESPATEPLPYTSRTIDIDILFYGQRLVFTETLMIPHPRIHERLFTLVPLCEIAPGFIHPVLKKTIRDLVTLCHDTSQVIRM